nr:hypothetical protein Iba_chr14aCG4230 [Ipomoea batatas]GME10771.1 hypothetical protein Iba_scaffold10701CG0010 [Ipomoea batatas]GME15553.1 hypothetical protein Iba_scaffold16324CG0020 [Ipomoea batatas]
MTFIAPHIKTWHEEKIQNFAVITAKSTPETAGRHRCSSCYGQPPPELHHRHHQRTPTKAAVAPRHCRISTLPPLLATGPGEPAGGNHNISTVFIYLFPSTINSPTITSLVRHQERRPKSTAPPSSSLLLFFISLDKNEKSHRKLQRSATISVIQRSTATNLLSNLEQVLKQVTNDRLLDRAATTAAKGTEPYCNMTAFPRLSSQRERQPPPTQTKSTQCYCRQEENLCHGQLSIVTSDGVQSGSTDGVQLDPTTGFGVHDWRLEVFA